jgi:hypothetical protein
LNCLNNLKAALGIELAKVRNEYIKNITSDFSPKIDQRNSSSQFFQTFSSVKEETPLIPENKQKGCCIIL